MGKGDEVINFLGSGSQRPRLQVAEVKICRCGRGIFLDLFNRVGFVAYRLEVTPTACCFGGLLPSYLAGAVSSFQQHDIATVTLS